MTLQTKHIYEFGPFRLDAAEHLLLRDGEAVPLTPKAFDLLLALVERHGHLLEKDELLKNVWPDTFVEEANLASNISQLRKALGDGENGERYIETIPKRGYRFVAGMREAPEERGKFIAGSQLWSQEIIQESSPGVGSGEEAIARTWTAVEDWRSKIVHRMRGMMIALVTLIAFGAGLVYIVPLIRQRFQANQPLTRTLQRLTFDAGLQSEPTLSPDGRWLAYSSDRGGNFDIWVKPVAGGDPVQVTKSLAHDWQPDWSPDGSQIVFRSERNGGGLFVAPPSGGAEQKIADFGYLPRWSRDGSQILFASSALRYVGDPPKLYVMGLDGSPPREVLAEFMVEIRYGLLGGFAWHPDGQRISVWGEHKHLGRGFWTIPLTGGAVVKSGISPQVEEQLGAAVVTLQKFLWSPSGRFLYFVGLSQGVRNLWRVEVEPQTLRWIAGPERLTVSPGEDADMAISADGKKLAFSTRLEPTRVWSFPFDAASGLIKGEGQPLTPAGVEAWWFGVSRDGQQIAYIVRQADKEENPSARRTTKNELWKKSLVDGKETLLMPADGFFRFVPHWSPDGTRLAYQRSRPTKPGSNEREWTSVILPASGGAEEPLTTISANNIGAGEWTADGRWLLGLRQNASTGRFEIGLFPLAAAPQIETEMRVVVSDSKYNLFQPEFSPDERWISFNATPYAGVSTINVIPASGGKWIQVTEGKYQDDKARWAPDGKAIYFISNRTGFLNVWGIRFDPGKGRPMGEPFQVTALESPRRMIFPRVAPLEMALAGGRLFLNITEASGNVWLLENMDR